MTIREVISALERKAPLPLQENFDNAGLQVGKVDRDVSSVLICLDITEAVIDEAVRKGCNLVVSHHPLLFHKLSCVTDKTMVGRCVMSAVKNDITIVSMHTNVDVALGGVNYKIAEKLGLKDVHFIGEEKEVEGITGASGVMGTLSESLDARSFIELIKERFHAECVQANELLKRQISTVAICGGAGDFFLDESIRCGADAFITGEMHYHFFFGHEQEIQIAVFGHYQSEQFTSEVFRDILQEIGVECYITETCTNPIYYF